MDLRDVEKVAERWPLPAVYLDFLTRFSPIKVMVKNRRFWNPFWLFGAGELIEGQVGYSISLDGQLLDSWPKDLVVIASHGGDPFALDLTRAKGGDAPVVTAEHGMGYWEFGDAAGSFTQFLESLLDN